MKLDQLKTALDFHLNTIGHTAKEFPWADKQYYAMWLRQTYAFVCHSTRLLTLASAKSTDQNLHNRYLDHAMEEKSHEKLLERDFKVLGLKIEDYPELANTAAFYQTQYYWAQQVHPNALFGYILLLEGLAVKVGGDVYNQIKKHHGDPCCNFIRVHVEADQDHLPKAFQILEKADPNTFPHIARALELSSHYYHSFMKDILAGQWNENKKAA
jgi:hypothetical protein